MNSHPVVISPEDSVERAAELMDTRHVGALPVCDGGRLVGLVTGRHIAERRAAGDARVPVSSVMTREVRWATTEDDPRAAELLMSDLAVRRLPVMDHERKLVGIVSRRALEAVRAAADAEDARSPRVFEAAEAHH
jgi:CBS domain-containing protein